MQEGDVITSDSMKHIGYRALPPGEGSLLGVDGGGRVYLEILQADTWLVRLMIDKDGRVLSQTDEREGDTLLSIPADCRMPQANAMLRSLNWNHGRWRGLRMEESLQERVHPIALAEKMSLIERLGLGISPMMLAGTDESVVLSSVALNDERHLMCRKLRLVYSLPTVRHDESGLPYDYDSSVVYQMQVYDAEADVVLPSETGAISMGVKLSRPMDCIRWQDRVYLFDAGLESGTPHLHIWKLA